MKITLLTGKTFDLEHAFNFPLKVVSSLRTKRLSLKIDTKKRIVVLSMPKFCTKHKAFDFVSSHRDWVEEHLLLLPKLEDFENETEFSLFGQNVKVVFQSDFGAPKLIGTDLFVGGQPEFIHRRVRDFIKKTAKLELTRLSKQKALQLGQQLENVAVKEIKSRWGSCSSLANINYNWRIALAPVFVIDYLVCHEVAHLKHHNHSQAFWQTVNALCPTAEEGNAWLKKNGMSLYKYR